MKEERERCYSAVPPPSSASVCDSFESVQETDGTESKRSLIRPDQLAKFQELRNKRVQIQRTFSSRRVKRLVTKAVGAAENALEVSEPEGAPNSNVHPKQNAETTSVPSHKEVVTKVEVLKAIEGDERFKNVPSKRLQSKSKLEKALEDSIRAGEHNEAQKLNDRLSDENENTRMENAVKRAWEIRAAEEQATNLKAKKRPKLQWGLGVRERWERKGNM